MKKTIFSFATLLLLCCSLFSQNNAGCYTVGGAGAIGQLPVALSTAPPPGPYHIKVYVHVLQKPDGTLSQSDASIAAAFANLDAAFNPHNIFFYTPCEKIVIPVSDQNFINPELYCDLFPDVQYEYADGLSFFLGPDVATAPPGGDDARGIASNIPGKKLWIVGTHNFMSVPVIFSPTVMHEVGHCLGLWHTYNGTTEQGGFPYCFLNFPGDPDQCCELVDMGNNDPSTNGLACGDHVADTPADPRYWQVDAFTCGDFQFADGPPSNCFSNTNPYQDADGETYMPMSLFDNFMSDTKLACMEVFTLGQGERMRCILEVSPVLQPVWMNAVPPESADCASFEADPAGCTNTVQFSSEWQGQHEWTVGGVVVSTSQNLTYTFPGPGTYVVEHEFNGVTSSLTVTIVGTDMNSVTSVTTIAPNILSDQFLLVNCTLLVTPTAGYEFNNLDAWMATGATVIVEGISKLNVFDSHFRCCDLMWKGFETRAGADLVMYDNRVECAEFALKANGTPVNAGNDISSINLRRNVFDRNFVGVYVPISGVPVPQLLNFNSIRENTFDCTAALPAPYPGQASPPVLPAIGTQAYTGVWVAEVPSIGVGNFPGNYAFRNTFQNLANGVYSERVNLDVLNAEFINIQQHQPYQSAGFETGNGIRARSIVTGLFTLTQQGYGDEGQPSFQNCWRGILAEDSNVDISQNRMLGVTRGITVTNARNADIDILDNDILEATVAGIQLLHNDAAGTHLFVFDNDISVMPGLSSTGINVQEGSTPHTDAELRNNRVTMQGAGRGIFLLSSNGMKVTGNTVGLNGQGAAGIRAEGCAGGLLQDNTATGQPGTVQPSTGMLLRNSPGMDYCCNTVDQLQTGIFFVGNCDSPNGFQANQFLSGLNTGLLLDPGVGQATTTILGQQNQMGNRWHEDVQPIPVGAQHNGGFTVAQNSQFFVDPLLSQDFLPNIFNPLLWFFTTSVQNPNCPVPTCGACSIDCFGNDPTSEFEKKIAENDVSIQNANAVVRWIGERSLFGKLEAYPNLLVNGSALQAFHSTASNNEVGAFYGIDTDRKALFQVDATTAQQLDAMLQTILGLTDQINAAREALANASPQDSITIVAEIDSLALLLGAAVVQAENFIVGISSAIQTSAAAADGANSTIATLEVFEANEKTVNDIVLTALANGATAFSSQQVVDLQTIAQQCPYTGGNAVFRARSLLSLSNDETDYDDDQLCQPQRGSEPGKVKPQKLALEPETMALFPNPANGKVTLTNSFSTGFDLVIYDLNGTEIAVFKAMEGGLSSDLDIGKLSNGIYLCKAIVSSQVLATERLVVIH